MKLIIELPDKTIAHIRSDYGHKYFGSIRDDDKKIIMKAIYNGTPLEEALENQKTGHWVVYSELTGEWEGTKKYACDKCGEKVGVFKSNFCPNCGAKMEGENNGENNGS